MFVSLVHECCVKCRGHWQLVVLCPVENRVVWFCSLRRKPDVLIKSAINKYGNLLNVLLCNVSYTTRVQHYCCRYYLKNFMFLCIAFKTLNSTSEGKSDQTTPRWIEIKVSHTIKNCFVLISIYLPSK